MTVIGIAVKLTDRNRWRGIVRLSSASTIEVDYGTFGQAHAFCMEYVKRLNGEP